MRLLVTRALEDAGPLAQKVRALGHEPVLCPLLEIRDRARQTLSLDGVRALLFTSANGVRAFARQSARRDVAVFAVGDATASAARSVGFGTVDVAEGDVAALCAHVRRTVRPDEGPLLHVTGSDVAGDLVGELTRAGYGVGRAIIYEAAALQVLPGGIADEMRAGRLDGVLLFSPRTAQIFVDVVGRAGLQDTLRRITAYCLASSVAAALAPHSAGQSFVFAQICVAPTPMQSALLDLLAVPEG